mmetsp:Transcript_48049/g.140012  ORF Transcript_48049/g.140012 Transcript_48049/m.140012 type:complete len:399 (-) Transcript_48049:474-1670(-)
MISRAIEVKAVSNDKLTGFETSQRKAREQVIGHLAKRLHCSLNFGGVGEEDVVRGIVLSMVSVQVLEMQITKNGNDQVGIVFRQTAHVPLLGKEFVPPEIYDAVTWDMTRDGVLLLASAMLAVPPKSLFSNGKLTFSDESSKNHYRIQEFLGSGSFAHVVQLDNDTFMKIPRSARMVQSLKRECEILQKLAPNQEPWFPRIVDGGVSAVNFSIRSEISQMEVLRLKGIIGCSLNTFRGLMSPNQVYTIMAAVYDALEYAHSKEIYHMDVRPSNIIVNLNKENELERAVLLADWGCGMFGKESIKADRFVGCVPYAHDMLLTKRAAVLKPKPCLDFASLGYTWFHVMKKEGVTWHFERPTTVSPVDLEFRRNEMKNFFNDVILKDGTACSLPKVQELFV